MVEPSLCEHLLIVHQTCLHLRLNMIECVLAVFSVRLLHMLVVECGRATSCAAISIRLRRVLAAYAAILLPRRSSGATVSKMYKYFLPKKKLLKMLCDGEKYLE